MPWARASESDRNLVCPGPLVIPRREQKSERSKEALAWGQMVHAWKATGEIRGEKGYEKHARLFDPGHVNREELWPSTGRHEVALARNTCTKSAGSLENGSDKERDEWKASHNELWEVGTADYVGEIFGDLWVDDLKTGSWPPTPPGESLQIRWYALVAARVRGYEGNVVVSITHWPRYPKGRQPVRYWDHVTQRQLEELENRLGALNSLLRSGAERVKERLNPGQEQCQFCPSALNCDEAWIPEER